MIGVLGSAWSFVVGVWNGALTILPTVLEAACKISQTVRDAGTL